MKKTFPSLLICILSLWAFAMQAQNYFSCGTPNPPGALRCSQSCIYCDLNGFTDKNDQFLPAGANLTLCLGSITLENPRWYGFIAGTSTVVIGVTYVSCLGTDGLQAAVLTDCNVPVACLAGPNPAGGGVGGSTFNITLNNLVVGAPYQLLLDGLNGDVCSYTLSVLLGSATPLPLGPVGNIVGQTAICPNATVEYSIPPVANAVSYTWTAPAGAKINGAGNVLILPAATGSSVDITFGTAGGNVCVTASNACNPPVTRCLAVTNTPLPIKQLDDLIVCASEVPFEWPEEPHNILATAGTYVLTSTPYASYLGCDSIVRQKVKVLPLIVKNLPTIYLCEGECFSINGFEYCDNGTHQEILTSYQGCDSIVNFTTVVIPLQAVVQQPDTLTCTKTSVTLTSNGSTNANGVIYQWFNEAGQLISNTTTAVASSAGNYALVLTRAQGGKICHDTAIVYVPADLNVPQVSAGPPQTLTCVKTEVQLQGSGSLGPQFSYFWTASNGGNIVSGSNTLKPIVNAAGNYKLRVTNNINGCTATSSTSVTALTLPPAVTVGGGAFTCTDPFVTIQTTTNANNPTFAWNGPNNFNSVAQNPTVNVAGDYLVTVTDGNTGCTSVRTAVVTANNNPPGAFATGGSITCLQDSVVLQGNATAGGSSFAWTGPNGFSSTKQSPKVALEGLYNLLVTGTNGCTSTASTNVVKNTTPPGAVLTPSNTLNCNNTSVNLFSTSTANPTFLNHIFTRPDGTQDTTGTIGLLVVNTPGDYIVKVTNIQNGCVSKDTAAVILRAPVSASLTTQSNNTCFGDNSGAVSIAANGGNGNYSYSWSNSATTASLSALSGGQYTVTVVDGENCSATLVASILEPAPIVANASSVGQSALGVADGSISLAPSGGTPGYTYLWSNAETTSAISGLLPGFYTVTITDSKGCTKVSTLTVNQYNCTVAGSILATNVRCNGNNNGAASVSLSGGSAPFSYVWSTGSSAAFIANLAPDNYTVTITDANNCPVLIEFEITEPDSLRANAVATGAMAININDGVASALPSGGSGVYTYLWSNGETTSVIDSLGGGFYTVTVTDTNGCSDVQTVEVEIGNCSLTTTFLIVNPACYDENSGQATIVLSGGFPPFTYNWSNGGSNPTVQGLYAGTYPVSVTDANGCQIVDTAFVVQPALLDLQVDTFTNTICENSPFGSALVTYSGGTGLVNIVWSNTQTGALATNLVAGIYTAVASDENGCTAETNVQIFSVDTIFPVIMVDTVTVPLGPSGTVVLTASNTQANIVENCSIQSVNFVPAQFDCAQLGYHSVVMTATDKAGNATTANLVVKIVDNAPPILICPASIIRCFGNDLVQYSAPSATDNCLGIGGGFALTQGLPSGSIFPLGTTTNTYTYTDGQGNVGSCSFEVTILTPLIVLVDSVYNDIENTQVGKIDLDVSGSLSPYTYEWFKNGSPIANTNQDPSGLGIGTYTVIVTDANGCTSSAGPAKVISVVDTKTPSWTEYVDIYPNPTAGGLSILFPDAQFGNALDLAILDLTGRKWMDLHTTCRSQQDLQLQHLPDGVYILYLNMGGQQLIRKVVVQK